MPARFAAVSSAFGKRLSIPALLATMVLLALSLALPPDAEPSASPLHLGRSAAIVDQLSLTFPNSAFVQQATDLLHEQGYAVDYYHGENVTVDFYHRLPTLGYDVLVLRTHSTANHSRPLDHDVVLFTNEEYRPGKHGGDVHAGRLSRVAYTPEQYQADGKTYFAIRPRFLERLDGSFDGALVLMMGCQGLENPSLAHAFFAKGAAGYVGWDSPVSAQQTDAAILTLLQQLQTTDNAQGISTAVRVLPADPDGSNLLFLENPEIEPPAA